jgi:hypothetical protein
MRDIRNAANTILIPRESPAELSIERSGNGTLSLEVKGVVVNGNRFRTAPVGGRPSAAVSLLSAAQGRMQPVDCQCPERGSKCLRMRVSAAFPRSRSGLSEV